MKGKRGKWIERWIEKVLWEGMKEDRYREITWKKT